MDKLIGPNIASGWWSRWGFFSIWSKMTSLVRTMLDVWCTDHLELIDVQKTNQGWIVVKSWWEALVGSYQDAKRSCCENAVLCCSCYCTAADCCSPMLRFGLHHVKVTNSMEHVHSWWPKPVFICASSLRSCLPGSYYAKPSIMQDNYHTLDFTIICIKLETSELNVWLCWRRYRDVRALEAGWSSYRYEWLYGPQHDHMHWGKKPRLSNATRKWRINPKACLA